MSDHRDAPDRPVEPTIVQYRDDYETYRSLPRQGRARDRILAELQEMHDLETGRWEDGFVSGAVYNGDPDHIDFVNRAYAIHSQSNPLHTDLWPSAVKFESEIVAMTASMLGGDGVGGGPVDLELTPHVATGKAPRGPRDQVRRGAANWAPISS